MISVQNIQNQAYGRKIKCGNIWLFYKGKRNNKIFQKNVIGKKVENKTKRKSNMYKLMKKKYNKYVTNT